MKGTVIFTDKDHIRSKGQIFPALRVQGSELLSVSSESMNGFYGFGVAITPATCYELSLMNPADRHALLENIYTEKGIGLSVGRLCIGASDYSAELYSYDDEPFDTELKHFSVSRDEQYVIPMIKEILAINPNLYLFASPWSPPFWMKTGGSMCGGYMRSEFLDCYADYIIKFIRAYAEHGIKISAITPQNEPNTQQSGHMPACIWHPEIEAKFIGILKKKFAEQNLDIEIWMYDHNFNDTARVLWQLDNCHGLSKICDGVAFHYYNGTVEQTAEVTRKYPNLKLHFTEGGPRLTENYSDDWCKWGTIVSEAIKTGYRSFTGWNLILDEMGGPCIGPFMGTCGGLVTRDSRTGELRYSGQYQAFSHIAPYVTPKSDLYPVYAGDTFGLSVAQYPKIERQTEGFVIDNHDGKIVAVLINQNDKHKTVQIDLCGKLWYFDMQGNSISTVIVE